MNFFKLALWLAIISICLLLFVVFSPAQYMVLRWKNLVFSPGMLFPFLLSSWITALASLALNFIYAERLFIIQERIVSKRRKYIPAMLCIPAIISFCWFCYDFFRGFTAH